MSDPINSNAPVVIPKAALGEIKTAVDSWMKSQGTDAESKKPNAGAVPNSRGELRVDLKQLLNIPKHVPKSAVKADVKETDKAAPVVSSAMSDADRQKAIAGITSYQGKEIGSDGKPVIHFPFIHNISLAHGTHTFIQQVPSDSVKGIPEGSYAITHSTDNSNSQAIIFDKLGKIIGVVKGIYGKKVEDTKSKQYLNSGSPMVFSKDAIFTPISNNQYLSDGQIKTIAEYSQRTTNPKNEYIPNGEHPYNPYWVDSKDSQLVDDTNSKKQQYKP